MTKILIFFAGLFVGILAVSLGEAAREKKPPKQAGYQPKRPTEPQKPPTTWSNAQKPKTGGFLLGTDLFCVAEANKKLGYKRGVEDFAERVEKHKFPNPMTMKGTIIYGEDFDQIAKEMVKEQEADQ